ncbi:hypothetical protein H8356DRAFT_1339964 [Neocallimastix lanati (nom. inval.)]|nr:hypothetical protein H8356DRAFT_1339964 [Neocallimastix sp. JGI-2020a]
MHEKILLSTKDADLKILVAEALFLLQLQLVIAITALTTISHIKNLFFSTHCSAPPWVLN